jgi:hypothetical protein
MALIGEPSRGQVPERIKQLVSFRREEPVPWWVPWTALESDRPTYPPEGRPRFDLKPRPERFERAMREHRCWTCGDQLGAVVTFVTEPHWVVQGFAGEPPSHSDCAAYAATHCPYFVGPDAPLVCLWMCRRYATVKTDTGPLIEICGATHVDWFQAGKPAHRAQIIAAFARVMPKLRAMHAADLAAKTKLERAFANIMLHHVPKF